MLLRLLPEQITKFWAYIKYALDEVAATEGNTWTQERLNNVLQEMLVENVQVWICVIDDQSEDPKILALAVTSTFRDMGLGGNVLRLIALYGFDHVPIPEFENGYNVLAGFAKQKECVRIEAFTANEHIVRLAAGAGFKSTFYLSKET